MQLCGEHNMQVCIPSTPAQVYHMLRRQAVRPLRKPLIVMSPKSLLRHKEAVSSLEELAEGQFQCVIDEVDELDKKKVTRVVMCSGKVYYELRELRRQHELDHIAIVRLEQLYPFPYQEMREVIEQYPKLKEVIWCQEEPRNQGAWYTSRHRMARVISEYNPKLEIAYAGREPSAAPAAGYMALHLAQQEALLHAALDLSEDK